jgi:hypothetical protein
LLKPGLTAPALSAEIFPFFGAAVAAAVAAFRLPVLGVGSYGETTPDTVAGCGVVKRSQAVMSQV